MSSISKNVQNYRATITGPGHPARHPIIDYISIGIVVRVGFAGTETKNQTDLKVCFRDRPRDKRPSKQNARKDRRDLGKTNNDIHTLADQ